MIDTIVLTLNSTEYAVLLPDRFQPSLRLMEQSNKNFKSTQNPTKEEKQDIYYPNLTIMQRQGLGGLSRTMRIQFSAPKLLFKNNFDEVSGYDFTRMIEVLQSRLRAMGVVVTKETLTFASVSLIHYSKNIIYTNGTTSHSIISLISKANSRKYIKPNLREYADGGIAFRWHTNSYEVIWYDKLADLAAARKSRKSRIEQDYDEQLSLFGTDISLVPFEVLRIEVRLNTRQRQKTVFSRLELEPDLRLKSVFNEEYARKVILQHWDEMQEALPPISYQLGKIAPDLRRRMGAEHKMTTRTVLAVIAFEHLVSELGMPSARKVIEEVADTRTWYRLLDDSYDSIPGREKEYHGIKLAREQIVKMEPVQLRKLTVDKQS